MKSMEGKMNWRKVSKDKMRQCDWHKFSPDRCKNEGRYGCPDYKDSLGELHDSSLELIRRSRWCEEHKSDIDRLLSPEEV